jgi:hypothetical protein
MSPSESHLRQRRAIRADGAPPLHLPSNIGSEVPLCGREVVAPRIRRASTLLRQLKRHGQQHQLLQHPMINKDFVEEVALPHNRHVGA